MKILIFGATGGTGRELVGQALTQGYDVTAYGRNPNTLADLTSANLTVVRGDVLTPAAVENAVRGPDAVVCAIGAGAGRSRLREEGTRNIVRAMQQSGVRRLVCQSSLGVGASRAKPTSC